MEKLSGTVTTAPQIDAGVVLFGLERDDNGALFSCMAGVRFEGSVPKKGSRLTVVGEHKADLIAGRTPCFVFSAIEYSGAQAA
jgi:hypothetical protein